MGTEKFFVFNESGTLKRLKGRIVRFLDNEDPDNTDKVNIRASISVPASAEGLTPANNLSDVSSVATSRDNLSVPSDDEVAEGIGTKLLGPALYFDRSNDYVEVADDAKLTFSSSAKFGTNNSDTWSPNDNTPALTDGTGTLNQHYRVDSGAGTVVQGGSTLSIINGAATTAGQAVYYDGSVWRLKDVDDLPFSISFWIKHDFSSSGTNVMFGKYGVSAASREWWFYFTSNLLYFSICDSAGIESFTRWSVSDNSDKWTHICLTYDGAGPNSSNAFTAAADGMSLYVNGLLVSPTSRYNDASYTGMAKTAQPLWLGKSSSSFGGGEYRSLTLHNRELSATEVAQLAKGNDLGFADEWGGAEIYSGDSSTFASSLGNWTEEGATAITVAQSAGEMVITNTAATTGTRGARNIVDTLTEGKRYRITWTSRASSGTGQSLKLNTFNNSPLAATSKLTGSGTAGSVGGATVYTFTPTGSAETHSLEFVVSGGGTESLYFSLNNTGNGEVYNFDNITLTQVGILADLRAEDFNESAGKLMDRSSNNFVGVNNGATLVGKRRHISAATINLTNLPTSSAGLSAGEVWSNSGVLTIV